MSPQGSSEGSRATSRPDWLSGGGEMGALIRAMNWATTPLGPVESWPQSLRTTVSLCLSSTFPILIAWGPERVQLYNDAYRPICGDKHPRSMGERFNECWASALPAVGGIVDRAQSGEGSYLENLRMFLDRYGYLEEAFMTFSFSPIRDESGGVGGLFHPITEVTDKMLSARRTRALRELAARLGGAKSLADIGARLADARGELELDLPFVLLYELDAGGQQARRIGLAGLPADDPASPAAIDLASADASTWPLARAAASGTVAEVDDVASRFGPLTCGPYPESPGTALLLPIHPPGAPAPVACLIAGVSARRALDASYRAFYELLAATVTTAVANVLAYEQEQRRAAALAEIDRAKTAFFSNVSHEFRTPLTLMLGPLEDSLADPTHALSAPQRERQELVLRNAQRLLKLVNALLDFSRFEAGRVQASYEATDLAALTRDLASTFRSAIEKAGLTLMVDCAALPQPVWVDREMWDKIVLNLLSNAFKHTFEGEIVVRLRGLGDAVELAVSDTGTGIPAEELPRLFERFHRVQGAHGRSYEGSGIGLAMVQELVRMHGGSVRVESRVGAGSTFFVALPAGSAHLPEDRLNAGRSAISTATRAEAFVHEASGWVRGPSPGAAWDVPAAAPRPTPGPSPAALPPARVLLADDNADMRAYVQRLLTGRYLVEAVDDGQAALELARARPPDLVLTDVMMPRLDGFGLLRELKADARTAAVPVILLSARAGEEAMLEGLAAGASDYVVKPFSARELLARVEGAIQVARARDRLSEALEAMGDAFYVADRAWRFTLVNSSHERMTRKPRSETLGRVVWEVFPEAARPDTNYWIELRRCMDERVPVHFLEHYAPLDLWTDVRAHPTPEGIAVFFRDVSEDKRAEATLHRQAEFEQQLVGIVSHDLRNPLNAMLLGVAVLLQSESLDERATRVVGRIRSSAEHAVRLVRDLLDFTQARLGKGIPVTRQAVDLERCVRQALDEVQAAFPGRELRLSTEGDTRGMWDGDRLAQVMHNLTTNALKYGTPGAPVRVSVRGGDDEVLLAVHNAGEPIAPDLLPHLFKPLTRGVHESERNSSSIGLGLFIVDQLVRAHGGTVAVRSTAADGTTFTVRLPRGAPPRCASGQAASDAAPA